MRSGQDPADRVENAAIRPRLPMQTRARSHCIPFRGCKFANWASRVTGYDGVGWNIPGHHGTGADNGALTNRYAFKDDGIKANPDLVLDSLTGARCTPSHCLAPRAQLTSSLRCAQCKL